MAVAGMEEEEEEEEAEEATTVMRKEIICTTYNSRLRKEGKEGRQTGN